MPEDAANYIEEVRKLYGEDGTYRSFPIQPLTSPLRTRTDLLTRQFGDAETGIAAVSFAAAALWLLLDLDTPDIEKASSYRLAEQLGPVCKTAMRERSWHATRRFDRRTMATFGATPAPKEAQKGPPQR